MNLLPEEMILDIISRLPAESVLDCRRVSKTWRTLTYHPSFPHLHLLRQSPHLDGNADDQKYHDHSCSSSAAAAKVSFVALITSVEDRKIQLHYGEYDDDSNKKFKTINHPPLHCDYLSVSSCNGLICISKRDFHPLGFEQGLVYICNPITRESIHLPRFVTQNPLKEEEGHATFGFGYHPKTNEYKVVSIYYNSYKPLVGQVWLYTLGSGNGWRNKGEIHYRCRLRPGVLANGALYWPGMNDGKIVSFDLVDEEFRLIPSPPCFHDFYQLRVLRGLLCAVHQKEGECVMVWSLKKKNNMKALKGSSKEMMKEKENQTWSWSLELRMEWVCSTDFMLNHDPFALTNSGEVLFWDDAKCLCRYNPETTFVENL